MPMPVSTIQVKYVNRSKLVTYQATGWGTLDNPPKLWIDDAGNRYYIMLDKVEWYGIGDYNPKI